MADATLEKIAKLLNKAENTDNPAEREAFYAAAQALATKHSLTLAQARMHTKNEQSKSASGNRPTTRTEEVGVKGDRAGGAYAALLVNIAKVNGCRSVFSNREVTLYGMEVDIDQTLALYAVISIQMIGELMEYLDGGSWRATTDRTNARKSFIDGYISRISYRLSEARRRANAEWEQENNASSELVVQNRDKEVREWFFKDAPRNRDGNIRYVSATMGGTHHASRRAGDERAQNANLHNSMELPE